jgi:hypothetical protein
MIDSNRQYLQTELPSDVFNSGNGDIKNFNGRAVKVAVNGNGTRSLSDLGDYGTYQSNKAATDAMNASKAAMDTKFAQDRNDVNAYNTKFQNTFDTANNAINEKYQIPNQVAALGALKTRINDLTFNSGNTGQGGYSSNDQVDRAISQNYLPNYNNAISNLGTSETAANNELNTALTPVINEGNTLESRLAREMTGFTQEQQDQLSVLLQKMQGNQALTQQERAQANTLAAQEDDYQHQLELLKAKGSDYVTVGAGQNLVDPSTGKVIFTGPYKPTGGSGGTNPFLGSATIENDPLGLGLTG